MKILALLVVSCVLYTALVTAVFRWGSPQGRAALMMRLYLLSLAPLYFAFRLSPAELGLLPAVPGLVLPNDFAWFLVPYTAAIWGGILQLYNLTERGFSLRILIDIDESPRASLAVDEILRGYGAGEGIAWMLQKRVDDLTEQGLIRGEGARALLTPKGRWLGNVYARLRAALRLPPGP